MGQMLHRRTLSSTSTEQPNCFINKIPWTSLKNHEICFTSIRSLNMKTWKHFIYLFKNTQWTLWVYWSHSLKEKKKNEKQKLTSALDCQNCRFFWTLCKFIKRCSNISSKTSCTLVGLLIILQKEKRKEKLLN